MEAYLYYELTNEPKGSGELIIEENPLSDVRCSTLHFPWSRHCVRAVALVIFSQQFVKKRIRYDKKITNFNEV